MFERYTEHARRAIFFARYEASSSGSWYIEAEHLLLGLLREDQMLRSRLPSGGIEQIRKRIEESSPRHEKITTSVNLPLSDDAKRALAFAAQESKALNHKVIDCGHLVLGLLRLEKGAPAALLPQYGIDYLLYHAVVSTSPLPRERNPERTRSLREMITVNRLLIHVLAQIPEDKLKIPFHIGVETPIPLAEAIDRYIAQL